MTPEAKEIVKPANQETSYGGDKQMMSRRFLYMSVLAIAMSTPCAQTVLAEEGTAVLEEIVVTARKREEALQKVPVAISVVSGEQVRASGIEKLEDLAPTIPNFHYSEAVSANDQIAIRGIVSGVNLGFENSVGQVFDGVFFGRSRYGRALFMDLQRIEILKGPQGALIGKNTTAGAINLTSAKPTSDFEGYLTPTWEFEGDQGYVVEGAVSGPLSERVRARLSFRAEQKDGYYRNLTRNTKEMNRDEYAVRGQIEWDLSEAVTATLFYQYGNQTRQGRTRELTDCVPDLAAALAAFGEDCQFNYTNTAILLENGEEKKSETDTEAHLGILTVDWRLAAGTVTSITAFSKYQVTDHWDGDLIAPEGISLIIDEDYRQVSQELRFTSPAGQTLDYIVGLYYLNVNHDAPFKLDFNFQGPPPLPNLPPPLRARNNRVGHQESNTIALFGEADWNISEVWRLVFGLRYTHEKKDATHREFATAVYTDDPIPQPPGPAHNSHDVSGSRTEDKITPSFTVQWFPTEDQMLYGKVSRGFKGGGFDLMLSDDQADAERNFEFQDETVLAFEAGAKLAFPEAGVRLNLAAFRSKFKDLQVSTLAAEGATVFRVGNAASAISQGVEADLTWFPVNSLRLSMSGAYLDAKFDKYDTAPCYGGQTVEQGCIDGNQNLHGKPLQYSPDWSFTFDGQYTVPVGSALELILNARAYFNDDQVLALDQDPLSLQKAYWKFDASVVLADIDQRWRVTLIGRNLSNKKTANFANDGLGAPGSSFFRFGAPPRSFSLQAQFRFGPGR